MDPTEVDLEDYKEQGFGSPEAMQAYVNLKASNHDRFNALVKKGFSLPSSVTLSMQVESLLEILGPEIRAEWAALFEMKMSDLLTGVEEEMPAAEARAKLLEGVTTSQPAQPSQLIR